MQLYVISNNLKRRILRYTIEPYSRYTCKEVIMNKKNKIFVILLIILLGCKKEKPNDISDQIQIDGLRTENTPIPESKKIVSQENIIVEQDKPIIIEPKQIENNIYIEYLKEYFSDNDYILLELPLSNRIIYFAEHRIKGQPQQEIYGGKIFDTAVVFEIIDGKFYRYLLIKNFLFINEDDSVNMKFFNEDMPTYGFGFIHTYLEKSPIPPELAINTYSRNGYSEADTFFIRWNEKSNSYEHYNYLIDFFGGP
jgi:hypothetical protein